MERRPSVRRRAIPTRFNGDIFMGTKKRKESWNPAHYDDGRVDDNPFVEALFKLMESPEGQKIMRLTDKLWAFMNKSKVKVDAQKRLLIWPKVGALTLDQSILHLSRKYPNFPLEDIDDFITDWLGEFEPDTDYTSEQIVELDTLTDAWVNHHWGLPEKAASKT
jgi:hypothetical protein